jgi:hypothetical protein
MQSFMEKLYTTTNHALRVSPYFQILALFKRLEESYLLL